MANTRVAVALALPSTDWPGQLLLVQRPESAGEEFPGMWGLPAAFLQEGEAREECALRIAREKLRLAIRLGNAFASGRQRRKGYVLAMTLYQGETEEEPRLPTCVDKQASVTYYTAWRWGYPRDLAEAAQSGSLCSQLLLNQTDTPPWPRSPSSQRRDKA